MNAIVRFIAWPFAWAAQRNWTATLVVRGLPKRIRIAVIDRLEGLPLPRAHHVLPMHGAILGVDTADEVARRVLFRAYETEELDLLDQLVSPGDVCVDVGANIGLYTVALAQRVGRNGQVLAFEADPRNAAALRRNVALNQFEDRAHVEEVALWHSEDTLEFHLRDEGFSGHGSVHRYEGHVASISVPALPLDLVLEREQIDRVALLKVDVEGADMAVYEGARTALEQQAFGAILAEWNGYWFPGLGWSVEEFLEFFSAFGYYPASPNLKAWEQLMEDPSGRSDWVVNVLLVPGTRSLP